MVRTTKRKPKLTKTSGYKKRDTEFVSLEQVILPVISEITTAPPNDFKRPILENSFKEYVQKQRQFMHYSLTEIADKLGVREEHLRLLEEEGLNRYLPEVYVRSILKKYCLFLHLDYEQALQLYENEVATIKTPGENDYLPNFKPTLSNRINLNYRKVFLGLFLLVILIFSIYQTDMLVGKPKLIVSGVTENMKTDKPFISLSGSVKRTKKLLFNGQEILLDGGTKFQIDNYNLTVGWNVLKFEAFNHLGRIAIKEYNIEFIEPVLETTTTLGEQ
jgi:hypothetical protein